MKGKRLTKADMIPGDTPFIGSTRANNGVTAWVGNTENHHPAGTITITYNGSVGEVFYQADEFVASDDVTVLYPKFECDEAIALYCCGVLRRAGLAYAYEHKWTKERMSADTVALPATRDGNPDWEFMARYVRAMKKLVIADVVKYKDEVLEATRSVVSTSA